MATKIRRSRKAVEFAKKVVEFRKFKPKADPNCTNCNGTGEYTAYSGHNGDPYETDCDCKYRDRPEVRAVTAWDDELLEIANFFLQGL